MKLRPRRSGDVEQVLTAPRERTTPDARLAFDSLYRENRDDLFAYVSGLLRDRSAAEDVTAAAFERAYRKRASF